MSIYDVAEYLVIKKLCGYDNVVRAIYDYFVNNISPHESARKYGFSSRFIIRGYITRIVEKCGDATRARVLVKHVAPIVLRIVPTEVTCNEKRCQCLICGASMWRDPAVLTMHMKQKHLATIYRWVDKVIETIRRNLEKKKNISNH